MYGANTRVESHGCMNKCCSFDTIMWIRAFEQFSRSCASIIFSDILIHMPLYDLQTVCSQMIQFSLMWTYWSCSVACIFSRLWIAEVITMNFDSSRSWYAGNRRQSRSRMITYYNAFHCICEKFESTTCIFTSVVASQKYFCHLRTFRFDMSNDILYDCQNRLGILWHLHNFLYV